MLPQSAAGEETYGNKKPAATRKRGQAHGVVLLAPAEAGLPVAEYAPTVIKKAVVGTGAADKDQVHAMVKRLLAGVTVQGSDAADALALAICHAHHAASQRAIGRAHV